MQVNGRGDGQARAVGFRWMLSQRVAEAFDDLYYLERAARVMQVLSYGWLPAVAASVGLARACLARWRSA